jgi:activator of HSP90 ATPase
VKVGAALGAAFTGECSMSTPIHQEVVLNASPAKVYEALMDSAQHAAFTANGEAEISREVGGPFRAHGGAIVGRNVELVPNRRIVQAWRVANWPEGVYSIVRFELSADGAATRLVLDHVGVPDDQRPHIDAGWHSRYWEPLRKYLA